MSDTISSITGGLDSASSGLGSLGSAIGAIFGVGGMLMLGSFCFSNYEIPEQIHWGGEQQTTVHKLVGGTRIIDAMGRDDTEISWSGIFLGVGATLRAKLLDTMRQAGKPVTLSWSSFSFPVVIKSFEVDYKYSMYGKYQIKCIYLGSPPPTGALSLLQTIISDISAVYASASNLYNTVTSFVGVLVGVGAELNYYLGQGGALGLIAGLTGPLASLFDQGGPGPSTATFSIGNFAPAYGVLSPLLNVTGNAVNAPLVTGSGALPEASLASSLPTIGASLGSITNVLGGLDLNGVLNTVSTAVTNTITPILNGTNSVVGGSSQAAALLLPISNLASITQSMTDLAAANIDSFNAIMQVSLPTSAQVMAAALLNVQQSVNAMTLTDGMTAMLQRSANNLLNPAAA